MRLWSDNAWKNGKYNDKREYQEHKESRETGCKDNYYGSLSSHKTQGLQSSKMKY